MKQREDDERGLKRCRGRRDRKGKRQEERKWKGKVVEW